MNADATFEEGAERPVRLIAEDSKDLDVVSALAQDAVFPGNEMTYQASQRRFAILLNRFRWEDKTAADRRSRAYERVQSTLVFSDVLKVQTHGVTPDKDTVLSLLSVGFTAGEDGTGDIILTLAGDGAIRLRVEAINVTLTDVTRPYVAHSKSAPDHPE